MKHFHSMYVNDVSLSAHEKLLRVCEAQGVGMKAAALRWLMHHSGLGEGDGVVLGASSLEQMEENLGACEGGRLPGEVVDVLEDMW